MKIGIGITTINIPYFLEDILKNYKNNANIELKIIIIGDNKTPKNITNYCVGLENKYSIEIEYLNLNKQKEILKNDIELFNIMPENSGVRKMIANLLFIKNKWDKIIMIDDDNYFVKDCIIKQHAIVGEYIKYKEIIAENNWFNIYEVLNIPNISPVYPRGFPWQERFKTNTYKINDNVGKVDINQGWVLNDPDIDALTRLFFPVEVVSIKRKFSKYCALRTGGYTSFNNQNTSISKEISKIYFTPPAGGRNADIWTAYLMYKICNTVGTIISFGKPVVRQDRNQHNLFNDLSLEMENMQSTNYFVNCIESINLKGDNYVAIMEELITRLIDMTKKSENSYIKNYLLEYKIWLITIQKYI